MLQNEIDKLNQRLQAAFQVKRLLTHGLAIPVKTDDNQVLYDALDTSKPVTLEDWPDAQVFYVEEGRNSRETRPGRKVEDIEITAIIYTTIPEFEAFFKAQLNLEKFDYTGRISNPLSIVNQFLPGLTRWNHERALYALKFNVTLPVQPANCVVTCF